MEPAGTVGKPDTAESGRVKRLILIAYILLIASGSTCAGRIKGVWVECEGSNSTLSSPARLSRMIDICARTGVNTIFLQVYRHNRSWYDSGLADTSPFRKIEKDYNIDPLEYTIKQARKYNVDVHAWINVYRIGRKIKCPVVSMLGKDIITRDGTGRSLISYPQDKLPDGGYWMDPGNTGVQDYIMKITEELIRRYPGLSGIHLDFIRYPYAGCAPGSRFSGRRDFGYGKDSVSRFKSIYGYSPLGMNTSDRRRTLLWDNWRRNEVTLLVKKIYTLCKKSDPAIKVSCAVQPWADRAYLTAYQDWRGWIRDGIVDFVVLMNYTTDVNLAGYISGTAAKNYCDPPAYIGLGAYLMLNNEDNLYRQMKDCRSAKGVVLFSYDALLKNKNIFKTIAKNKWWDK